MKCTQFESAIFESTKKHVVFQSNQHRKMAPNSSRRSFIREFKLHYQYNNGKIVNQASKKFKVDRKQIGNWVKNEEVIQKQKWTSRSTRHGKVMFPIMEKELYKKFIDTRKERRRIIFRGQGLRIKCSVKKRMGSTRSGCFSA